MLRRRHVACDPDLYTAFAHEHADVAIGRMRQLGIRRLPIVDDAGKLVGIVTVDDLLARTADDLQQLAVLISREQRVENGTDRAEPRVLRD